MLNALTWETDLDARAYQPRTTFFERAAAAGVAVSSVALQRFADTGLTEAALAAPSSWATRTTTTSSPGVRR